MSTWTISGLAHAGGVGVETIRYYQRRGLLPTPERPRQSGLASGPRRYGEDDVRRLCFIRSAQMAGFTLEEIGELLTLDATDDRTRIHDLALERIAALNEKIAQLQSARDALRKLAQECGSGSAGPCPILLSFEQDGTCPKC